MAAIKRLGANGVVSDYTQLDQYADFLANQFGITDILQTNLGSLYVPVQSGAPSSPIAGQIWLDTSVGNGRLYLRDNAGNSVPYLACRQVQKTAEISSQVTTSTSLTDATGLSISNFSSSGGRLKISLVPGAAYIGGSGNGYVEAATTASITAAAAELVAVVNGVQLGGLMVDIAAAAGALVARAPVSAFSWDYVPPANLTNVVVKIQFRVISANMQVTITSGTALLIEEWGN